MSPNNGMIPGQSFSISRRTLDVEDYVDIGRRHAGWIAGPAFLGIVASIVIAFLLPNQYVSKATMQITPAQISDNMVQAITSTVLNERVEEMEQNILSRGSLSQIINDPRLNLYREDLKTKPLEDVIEDMKNNIHINLVTLAGAVGKRGASAFDISFSYSDRYKAQLTVQTLMSKFDEQNLNTQKTQMDAAMGFFDDELQKAKADLSQANDALTAFKEGHQGELPESAQTNVAMESAETAKIESYSQQIYRDSQATASLEVQRAQLKGRLDSLDETEAEMEEVAAAVPGSPAAKQNDELQGLDKTIEQDEFQLNDLRKQYNEKFPTIRSIESHIDSLKAKRDEIAKQLQAAAAAEAAKPKTDVKTPASIAAALREREAREEISEELQKIDAQEKQITIDNDRLKGEQEAAQKASDEISQKLKDSTGVEAPLEELRRTQVMAEQTVQDLLKKKDLAGENSQLIERKAGENLDVLDTASLPVEPTSPKRYLIIGSGFAMSIILGFGMAGLQEAKDTSLKNLKDVRAYTNLPVLCSIPLLENTMLVKRKRRLTYLAWSAAVIVGAAAVSGAVVYYYSVTMKS